MVASQITLDEEYLESLRKYAWLEGNINHMYLDTQGLVTIGRGHLIVSVKEAQKLPFTNHVVQTRESDIVNAFEWVKKQKAGQMPGVYKNDKYNNLILTQSSIDQLAKSDIQEKIKILKKIFASFDHYPLSVQMALLDHWFNVRNASKFLKMIQAVKNRNWSAAAYHSHILTTTDGVYPRVILKAVRFCLAAQAEGPKEESSFCYKFSKKFREEGFLDYDDLLNALSKYQSTYSRAENLIFIEKLRRIDTIFKTHVE